MDTKYLSHYVSSSPFYVATHEAEAWDHFILDGAPKSWLHTRSGDWINWAPPEFEPRAQGWKLRISATPDNAAGVLQEVASLMFQRGVVFNHIATRQEHVNRKSKSANRSSSGRFITICPRDDNEFDCIASELLKSLDGEPGPYIPSDLRLGPAPVFARHGQRTNYSRRYSPKRVGPRPSSCHPSGRALGPCRSCCRFGPRSAHGRGQTSILSSQLVGVRGAFRGGRWNRRR